jgi:hypothetical protein
MRWAVPGALSNDEQSIASALKRVGKFYVFLREVLPELFTDAFQDELEVAYRRARGTPPIPAALLATVTLLQAYDQVSDAEAVVTARMDLRWQLVLGCVGAKDAPFSQGVLFTFRRRMLEHDLDQKLLDRTVELAKQSGKFGWKQLKVAFDSSPLLGAGRVEDTWNLIGRALSLVLDCAAKTLGRNREEIVAEAKLTLLGKKSLKASLDIDWDDPAEKAVALERLLVEVDALERWVATHAGPKVNESPLRDALTALRRVLAQDLEPDPTTGRHRIKQGVAKDRMPSLGDKEMRHGRKSKSKLFNGYKRHLAKVIGADIVVAATVRPANEPEHLALPVLVATAKAHGQIGTALIDRGYLANPTVEELRAEGTKVRCKPWPSRNGGRFTKEEFSLRLAQGEVECPAGVIVPLVAAASKVQFPAPTCNTCPKRTACTMSAKGRSISIHPQEELLIELRTARKTTAGREELRERVTIEHSLARVGRVQGHRSRYRGARKNTLDLRRCAVIVNLQAIDRDRKAA